MENEYRATVAEGAARVEAALRQTALAEPIRVFGIHGGGIEARRESAGAPLFAEKGYTEIKPARHGAWEAVPYNDIFTVLYNEGRRIAFFA